MRCASNEPAERGQHSVRRPQRSTNAAGYGTVHQNRRSPDSPKKHANFRDKYELPFTLLADEDHSVSEAYGVWVQKSFAGKKYMGVERSTFVIGPDWKLERIMRRVRPDTHADEVLAALAAG